MHKYMYRDGIEIIGYAVPGWSTLDLFVLQDARGQLHYYYKDDEIYGNWKNGLIRKLTFVSKLWRASKFERQVEWCDGSMALLYLEWNWVQDRAKHQIEAYHYTDWI